jgi:hypothetical protein
VCLLDVSLDCLVLVPAVLQVVTVLMQLRVNAVQRL